MGSPAPIVVGPTIKRKGRGAHTERSIPSEFCQAPRPLHAHVGPRANHSGSCTSKLTPRRHTMVLDHRCKGKQGMPILRSGHVHQVVVSCALDPEKLFWIRCRLK